MTAVEIAERVIAFNKDRGKLTTYCLPTGDARTLAQAVLDAKACANCNKKKTGVHVCTDCLSDDRTYADGLRRAAEIARMHHASGFSLAHSIAAALEAEAAKEDKHEVHPGRRQAGPRAGLD